jgi:hypothetical protein
MGTVQSYLRLYTLAEKDQLVKENESTIAYIEEGLKYPYLEPQPRSSYHSRPPFASRVQIMARLLTLAGQARAEHGDWGGAMKYYLDALNMGVDLQHGAPNYGALAGAECESIGQTYVEGSISKLNLTQSRHAVRRLEDMDEHRTTPNETLTEDKWWVQAWLLDYFKDKEWQTEICYSTYENFSGMQRLDVNTESRRSAYDSFTEYADRIIAYYSKPWPKQINELPPAAPTDPIGQTIAPDIGDTVFQMDSTTAFDRLLETQFALHEFRLLHGSYPDALTDLVPTTITAVPIDPFTNGQPLKYKRLGVKCLLYSVGPDAVDNGGTPITLPYHPNAAFGAHSERLNGDIVAGIDPPNRRFLLIGD